MRDYRVLLFSIKMYTAHWILQKRKIKSTRLRIDLVLFVRLFL